MVEHQQSVKVAAFSGLFLTSLACHRRIKHGLGCSSTRLDSVRSWDAKPQSINIRYLELEIVYLALKAFLSHLSHKVVLDWTDCNVKKGGGWSSKLSHLSHSSPQLHLLAENSTHKSSFPIFKGGSFCRSTFSPHQKKQNAQPLPPGTHTHYPRATHYGQVCQGYLPIFHFSLHSVSGSETLANITMILVAPIWARRPRFTTLLDLSRSTRSVPTGQRFSHADKSDSKTLNLAVWLLRS